MEDKYNVELRNMPRCTESINIIYREDKFREICQDARKILFTEKINSEREKEREYLTVELITPVLRKRGAKTS